MDARTILAILSITLLAGCFGDDADEPDDGMTEEEPTTELTNGTLSFSDSGTIAFGTQGAEECGAVGTGDTASHTWEIPAQQEGVDVRGKDFTITLTMGASGLDLDLFVYDESGQLLGSGTSFNVADGSTTEVVSIAQAPAGTYTITVKGCVAVNADYTVDGTVDLVAR